MVPFFYMNISSYPGGGKWSESGLWQNKKQKQTIKQTNKQTNKKLATIIRTNNHLVKQGLPNFTGHEVEHHVSEKIFKQAKTVFFG